MDAINSVLSKQADKRRCLSTSIEKKLNSTAYISELYGLRPQYDIPTAVALLTDEEKEYILSTDNKPLSRFTFDDKYKKIRDAIKDEMDLILLEVHNGEAIYT